MPIHLISSGDEGIALYNGGSSPIIGREVYVYDSGWVQAWQLWRCTSANPGTGTYSWVQFAATDKYAPSVAPASYSLVAHIGFVRCTYGDQLTTGVNYSLSLTIRDISSGTGYVNVGTLAVGRATTGHLDFTLPGSGWNSGDLVDGYAIYEDSSGYGGPLTTAAQITLL